MPRADAIEVEGVVVEVLPNKTYRVELSNGHRVVGFVPGKARLRFVRLGPVGLAGLPSYRCHPG